MPQVGAEGVGATGRHGCVTAHARHQAPGPGSAAARVSAHNLYAVLNRTESFRSLPNLDQEAMEQLLGAANGRKVWEFVHRNARRK